jgi:hypothetical protein
LEALTPVEIRRRSSWRAFPNACLFIWQFHCLFMIHFKALKTPYKKARVWKRAPGEKSRFPTYHREQVLLQLLSINFVNTYFSIIKYSCFEKPKSV